MTLTRARSLHHPFEKEQGATNGLRILTYERKLVVGHQTDSSYQVAIR